jgi:hypothetical protein
MLGEGLFLFPGHSGPDPGPSPGQRCPPRDKLPVEEEFIVFPEVGGDLFKSFENFLLVESQLLDPIVYRRLMPILSSELRIFWIISPITRVLMSEWLGLIFFHLMNFTKRISRLILARLKASRLKE